MDDLLSTFTRAAKERAAARILRTGGNSDVRAGGKNGRYCSGSVIGTVCVSVSVNVVSPPTIASISITTVLL